MLIVKGILTPSVWCDFCAIMQLFWDSFGLF